MLTDLFISLFQYMSKIQHINLSQRLIYTKIRTCWYQYNCPRQIFPQVFAYKSQTLHLLFSVRSSIQFCIPRIAFSPSPLKSFQFTQIFWAPTGTELNASFQARAYHSRENNHITSLQSMTQLIQSLSVLSPKEPCLTVGLSYIEDVYLL